MAEIVPDSPVPMYRQLADLIRERVKKGEFSRGSKIPSEAELGVRYGISRITVRQALSELEREELLEKVPGKGTFVRRQNGPLVERLTKLSGFGENVAGLGMSASYDTLKAEGDEIPLEAASSLGAGDGKAFVVERVLLADGRPVGFHLSYLPLWIIRNAPKGAFSREALDRASLYATMEKAGAVLHRAEEIVEPALADAEDAKKLGVEEGTLLLRVTRTVYAPDDLVLEHVFITYRSDAYTFRQRLYKEAES